MEKGSGRRKRAGLSIALLVLQIVLQPMMVLGVGEEIVGEGERGSLEQCMELARRNSYEMQIERQAVEVEEAEIGIVGSEGYPKVRMYAGSEYTDNIGGGNRGIGTVGEMFINPYTRYQTIMGIMLSYTVYDFGVNRGRKEIAKRGKVVREMEMLHREQEIMIKVIDVYSRIVMKKLQLGIEEEIIGVMEGELEMKRRLAKAGEIGRGEVREVEIRIDRERGKRTEIARELRTGLLELSYYTGEEYGASGEEIEGIEGEESGELEVDEKDAEGSIEGKMYLNRIKQKEMEIRVLRRSNYPRIEAYGRYYMYGMDVNNYGGSLGDIRPTNYTIGGSISMPIFDGNRNRYAIRKAEMEKKKLEMERAQVEAEYRHRLGALRSNLAYEEERIADRSGVIRGLEERAEIERRRIKAKESGVIGLKEIEIQILEERRELVADEVSRYAIKRTIGLLQSGIKRGNGDI